MRVGIGDSDNKQHLENISVKENRGAGGVT
jgi:hypothetical protein